MLPRGNKYAGVQISPEGERADAGGISDSLATLRFLPDLRIISLGHARDTDKRRTRQWRHGGSGPVSGLAIAVHIRQQLARN